MTLLRKPLPKFCKEDGKKLIFKTYTGLFDEYTGKQIYYRYLNCPDEKHNMYATYLETLDSDEDGSVGK
jgi:hypothetical protein